MKTWTMDQVRQARSLRVQVKVDVELVAPFTTDEARVLAAVEASREIQTQMAKALIRDAHTFAIEIDHRDCEVDWSDVEGEPWHRLARMWWNPSTTEVEMRGGAADGQRVVIQRVGDSIRVPRPPSLVAMFNTDAHKPTDTISDLADTYELVGWREDERVWVYAVR